MLLPSAEFNEPIKPVEPETAGAAEAAAPAVVAAVVPAVVAAVVPPLPRSEVAHDMSSPFFVLKLSERAPVPGVPENAGIPSVNALQFFAHTHE